MTSPGANNHDYRRHTVKMMVVRRDAEPHRVREWEVASVLTTNATAACLWRENAALMQTNAIANAAYALAHRHAEQPIEGFACSLAEHLLATNAATSAVRVEAALAACTEIVQIDLVLEAHRNLQAGPRHGTAPRRSIVYMSGEHPYSVVRLSVSRDTTAASVDPGP